MTKRPFPVTIISWLFIAAGTVGFIYHASEFSSHEPFGNDVLWVLFVRLLAVVGGVFTLRGADWGRWLLAAWMAYHVVLSVFHPVEQLIIHTALLAVILFFLFRPKINKYFKSTSR